MLDLTLKTFIFENCLSKLMNNASNKKILEGKNT